MRAALGILCLQCVLLAGFARAGTASGGLAPSGARNHAPTRTHVPTAAVQERAAPAPTRPSPQDLLLACPTTLDRIGHVVADVWINGKGPFRFIIDSGADHSTISPRLATRLGLRPSIARPLRVAGVTGTALMPSVPIALLRAGELTLRNTRLPVIWAPVMGGAAGVLGAAGLAQSRLMVDFLHNRVVISRSGPGSLPPGFARVRGTLLHSGLLSVPARVGSVDVVAIIDTGAQRTLGNQALYEALYPGSPARGKAAVTNVYGATQQVGRGELHDAPTIALGSLRIDDVVPVFGDLPIFGLWGLREHPAIIIGMDVLGTVDAFAIDFPRAELAIATPYYADRRWPSAADPLPAS